MAIDTIQKRSSSIGCYWPSAGVDRVASLWEYSSDWVGPITPPSPVGVPELLGLTMVTPSESYSTRRSTDGYSIHRR